MREEKTRVEEKREAAGREVKRGAADQVTRASQRPRWSLAKVAKLCKDQKLGEQSRSSGPGLERFRAGEKCWEDPQALREICLGFLKMDLE